MMKSPTPLRLLLVHDDPADAQQVETALRRDGFGLVSLSVDTRDDFLATLREFRPDVVISDCRLAVFDGVEAVRLAYEYDPLLPFVFFADSVDGEVVGGCMKAGASDYVARQHVARLPSAVSEALERARGLRVEAVSEVAHHASLAELRAIYEDAPLIMFVVDAGLHVWKTNDLAARFAGRTADEMIGRCCGEALRCLNLGDDSSGCGSGARCAECVLRRTVVETLETGRSHSSVEARLPFPVDGRALERVLLLSTSRLIVGDAPHALVTVLDITERARSEEALREREETYRALVNGLPDIVMRFDRSGRHLFVSSNVNQAVAIESVDFIGRTHRELGFREEDCRFWEESIGQVFATELPLEKEFTVEGKRGPTVFNCRLVPEFDAWGEVSSVLTVSRDVTRYRQAERDYQTLFHEMMDGCALHEIVRDAHGDPVDFRFLAVNPSFERMTRLDAARIVGRTLLEVLPEADRHWIETYRRVSRSGEPAHLVSHSAGLNRLYEVKSYCPAANQVACLFTDITERKQAEDALWRSEERYRSFVQGTDDLAFLKDHEFRYLMVNKGYERFLGRTADEIRGKTDSELMTPEAAAGCRDSDLSTLSCGGVIVTEEPVGSRLYEVRKFPVVLEEGRQGIGGFVRDITMRKRIEEALRASEAKYRDLFEQSRDAISLSALDGTLLDFNQAWLDMLGYSREEAGGLSICDVYAEPGERDDFLRRIAESGSISDEVRYRRKDGTTVLCQRSVTARCDSEGRIVSFQAISGRDGAGRSGGGSEAERGAVPQHVRNESRGYRHLQPRNRALH